MTAGKPFRRHLILFLILSAIGLAQLGWWVVFQVREGTRISHQQKAFWSQQIAMAEQWWAVHPNSTDDFVQWLSRTFPDLHVTTDGAIAVTDAALIRLDHTAARRVRMFIWEGGFFTLLMVVGMAYIYWTLRKEVEFERRQSTFLAATSHELKTPIASLRLFMDTLHDRQLTPAQREETFEVMRSDLQRLSDLIDRLLQAQVLMDEHRTLKLELTDLAEETRIAADLLRGAFIHHGIQLDDETEPNLRAMTEPEKWQLLVKNLLDNALKYSQDRGKVSIRLRRNGTYALLIVTDQGIGIEKKELEKIFERFYRIGREETRSTRGTGLGLFLVKRIAESFGGRAWAHSEGIGTGAEFSVEIPLAKEVV